MKSDLFNLHVSVGLGVLYMVNKEIMLIINKQGEGLSFINMSKSELIFHYIIKDTIEIYHYSIKLSDNHLLLACQDKWMKIERHQAYKEPTKIKLKYFYYYEKYKKRRFRKYRS